MLQFTAMLNSPAPFDEDPTSLEVAQSTLQDDFETYRASTPVPDSTESECANDEACNVVVRHFRCDLKRKKAIATGFPALQIALKMP